MMEEHSRSCEMLPAVRSVSQCCTDAALLMQKSTLLAASVIVDVMDAYVILPFTEEKERL